MEKWFTRRLLRAMHVGRIWIRERRFWLKLFNSEYLSYSPLCPDSKLLTFEVYDQPRLNSQATQPEFLGSHLVNIEAGVPGTAGCWECHRRIRLIYGASSLFILATDPWEQRRENRRAASRECRDRQITRTTRHFILSKGLSFADTRCPPPVQYLPASFEPFASLCSHWCCSANEGGR